MQTSVNSTKTLEHLLGIKSIISEDMKNALILWDLMYQDAAPWLKTPDSEDISSIETLSLPSRIAREKAMLAMLEIKTSVDCPSGENEEVSETLSARANYINECYQPVVDMLRTQLEYGVAVGNLIIKPYVYRETKSELSLSENAENNTYETKIGFDFVHFNSFVPFKCNFKNEITGAVFLSTQKAKGKIYTKAEIQELIGNKIVIKNRAFVKDDNISDTTILGNEIPLSNVPDWADFAPEVTIYGAKRLLFSHFKIPDANTIDETSVMGISGYGRAVSLIRKADEQYSRLLWEFEGSELAIDIDELALRENKNDKNKTASYLNPKLQNRLFRKVDLGENDTYKVFSPAIRDQSYLNGLNFQLRNIEDATGLARGTFSDLDTVAKTATETIYTRHKTQATVSDIQTALKNCLIDLVDVIDSYVSLYNLAPKGEIEMAFEFGDSVTNDPQIELQQRILLQQQGVSSPIETRMWYFGETKNQAQEAVKEIEKLERERMNLYQTSYDTGEQYSQSDVELNLNNAAQQVNGEINDA